MTGTPRLSIGLPVYNGENYLAAALGSLLDQDYDDFELIISDNASSDRTAEICRVFVAGDERVRYLRNAENIGAAANYNLTLENACGEYFKWAAHDDVCLPGYLERCIAVLDGSPDVVLCHSQSLGIDSRGHVVGRYGEERSFDESLPQQRFWQAISTPHVCIAVFGVMRREVLQQTVRHGDWVGADRNLLAQLALFGRVVLVPEPLFQRRAHPEASIHKFENERERLAWFDPGHAGKIAYPTWRRLQEYARAVLASPLRPRHKAACLARLARWLGARHHTGGRNARLMVQEAAYGLRSHVARRGL